ncbi:MAG: hypothetical protein RLZ25_513, partial [Pseudomonadota bacterium]
LLEEVVLDDVSLVFGVAFWNLPKLRFLLIFLD